MVTPSKPLQFHLWMPNLFNYKGGIQVYSAHFLEALQNLYPATQLEVFLKHDVDHPLQTLTRPNTRFHYAGRYPLTLRTPIFAAQLMGWGLWQRPALVLATHLHFTVAAHYLKRLTGIPYWAVAHGVEAWNITQPPLQAALHEADRILAVSNFTRDRLLQEQNLDPAKVVLLPNTFNPDRFHIAAKPTALLQQYHLLPEQPIMLTVARLAEAERYKGYDQLLAALPTIRQTIPNLHYIIVGEGSDRPRLEQLITQLQLQDCVTLAGFVPDRDLCDYYNLCDVFAMPSKREGFGIVYLEAMACGKPVLGGNQDGALDALRNGELGVLVNPNDVFEIAQTIIQILQKGYQNPLIYQPEQLRQKVINTFGLASFKATLGEYLNGYFMNESTSVSQ
jgi:glycosyltransferase involved in cell wall biosynthesis